MYKIDFESIDTSCAKNGRERREIEHTCAYSLLQRMLREHFDIISYEIKKTENGKPYIDNDGVFFSLSHTKDFVVCVVSDKEIGVDCEKIDNGYNDKIQKFAKRFFVENELRLLKDNDYSLLSFLKVWTAKEAVIKRCGGNMSLLKKIDVTKEKIDVILEKDYIISISCSDI